MKKRLRVMTVLAIILTAAAILPVAAAITRFTDVPDSNIFAEDIAWMDENEITTGCGTDIFCPTANVTREQMSAFMRRLATKQVVDAKTLEGMAAADFAAANHDHAGEYATPGHNHNEEYLPIDGTAANSAQLQGMTANDLLRVASYSFSVSKAPDDFARLDTFEIEAPVDGYLILSSSLAYNTSLAEETIWCAFALDGDGTEHIPNSSSSNTVKTHTAGSNGTCATQVVAPVSAGNHTITVMGFYNSLLNTKFQWGTASALFVPFGPTGSQPANFELPAPSPDQLP